MKKKNGFISTTVVYTFFFVFLMMLLFIIDRYSSNRVLLGSIKTDIKESLNKDMEKNSSFAGYIKSLYTANGENNLYLLDASLTNGAEDGSIRFSGANPNNYVCFATDEVPCPNENKYRIIGVFGSQVKLIKFNRATNALLGTDGDYWTEGTNPSYYYHFNKKHGNAASNDWETSLLNSINLNTNYLNNIDEKWFDLIADTIWNIGGPTSYIVKPKDSFTLEKEVKTSSSSKIGLMSLSDYGYATIPDYWNQTMNLYSDNNIKNNNWLFYDYEWTITSSKEDNVKNIAINKTGRSDATNSDLYNLVRPAFYLKSSVQYISGDGTSNNPYRVGM